MKRKILIAFSFLIIFIPCFLLLSACDNYNVSSFSILINNEEYSVDNNTVIMTYGDEFKFDDEIEIIVNFQNNVSKKILLNEIDEYGLTVDCNINSIPNAGIYFIKISGDVIDEITVKVIVAKKDIDMENVSWDYYEPFTFDGDIHSVELINLPSEISVDYENNQFSEAGTYNAVASLEYDYSNYNLINFTTPLSLSWEIKNATIDLSGVAWNYSNSFVYDGTLKKPQLQNVPNGVIASYSYWQNGSECEPINAGNYVCKISFTAEDDNVLLINSEIEDLDFVIEKRSLTKEDFYWNVNNGDAIDYDGTLKSVEIVNNFLNAVEINYVNDETYCNVATEEGDYLAYANISLTDGGSANYCLNFDDGIILEWKIEFNCFSLISISTISTSISMKEFKDISELEVGTTITLIEKEGYYAYINSNDPQNSYTILDGDIEIYIIVQDEMGEPIFETFIMVI